MKKILFIDPLSPEGHIQYNKYWLKLLDELNVEYEIVCKDGYEKEFKVNKDKIKFLVPNNYYKNKKILKKWDIFKYIKKEYTILKKIYENINEDDYEYVIFSSFENISFYFFKKFHKKNNCIILHNNLRKINNFFIKYILRRLSKKNCLISLSEEIEDNLKKFGIKTKLIRHPISDLKIKNIEEELIFSPSKNSCNESLIYSLFKNEELKKIVDNSKINIYIRSQIHNFQEKAITMSSKYLSEEEYLELFSKSFLVLLPYQNHFENRVSNVFFEAIANNKIILASESKGLKYFSKFNEEKIFYYKDVNDLIEKIKYIIKNKKRLSEKNFKVIPYKYSFNKFRDDFIEIIKINNKEKNKNGEIKDE